MEPIKEPTPLVLVTSSPHMHCGLTIGKSMREVMLALVPAIIASVYYFRMSAAIVMVTCVVSAIVFETICNKVMHKPNTVQDGSAALTGLLLAMCLPASMPPLFAAMGSMFAIVVGKAVFGGLGCNIFNPAHIGRAILLASFPQQMTNWFFRLQQLLPTQSAQPPRLLSCGLRKRSGRPAVPPVRPSFLTS